MADKAHLHNDGRLLDHIEHIERSADSGHMVCSLHSVQCILNAKSEKGTIAFILMKHEWASFAAISPTNSHAG